MTDQSTTPPGGQMPSTSELASTILDIAETSSTTSSAMTKSIQPEVDKDKASRDGKPRMSRMKQLLEKRHAHRGHKIVLGTRRQRLLEESKEKMRQSEYETARLSSRLDILHIFVDHALVDEAFLGKREMNPWRFKNPRLDRKYNFVNNLVTTQEMLVLVDEAKERSRRKPEEESIPGSSSRATVDGSVNGASNEEENERADDEPQVEDFTVTEENTDEKLPEKINNSTTTSEESEERSSEKEEDDDDENDESNKNTIYTEGRIKRVKLRKRKWKKSRASSASTTIIYAFGSSHNKGLCNYCGSLRCKGQINRTRMNINPNSLEDKIGQRISDLRGIYQGEGWQTSYNKKMRDRVNTLDKQLNGRLLNSRSSLQSSKK